MTIKTFLTELRFGKAEQIHGVAIIPVFSNYKCNIDFLTIEEAVSMGKLRVTEVSQSGSVPNLRAENLADKPVLLIDGEELIGAKQNRILNLSILLKEKSVCLLPVSCVERGRWSYRTFEFKPSQHVMPPKARAMKTKSVSLNIFGDKGACSDQGLVWKEVSMLHEKLETSSSTEAMYDAFVQKKREVNNFIQALKPQPDQIGYLLFIEEEPRVLEIIPRPEKYLLYHEKFVTASLIDAIGDRLMEISARPDLNYDKLTNDFINAILEMQEYKFEEVGCGINYRYQNEKITGAVLVYENDILHAVFFGLNGDIQRRNLRRRYY